MLMNMIAKGGSNEPIYNIGDVGQAGGYVFYDKGSYSDGWRYMECTPSKLLVDAVATDGTVIHNQIPYYAGRSETETEYPEKAINTHDDVGIGYGKINTLKGLKAFRYAKDRKASTVSGVYFFLDNAFTACRSYDLGGYIDWVIPSVNELKAIYDNLVATGKRTFPVLYYASSCCMDFNDPQAETLSIFYVRTVNFRNGSISGEMGDIPNILLVRYF